MRFSFLPVALLLVAPAFAQEAGPRRSIRVIDDAKPAQEKLAVLPEDADANPVESNPAGVSVAVLPQRRFSLGDKMTFRVTTKRAGFLVVLDVDATGRLSQIYPNDLMLAGQGGVDSKANLVTPGNPATLPKAAHDAAYGFVASAPKGVGMIVAVLSEAPLQIVDLPDVPTPLAGQKEAAAFIRESMRALTVITAGRRAKAQAPQWSVAVAYYAID
ncbi:DUF4384 domain-containing protein [Methylocystis heyeri]|nr:DUF4384 domain-containing protein [Methylocystis heyeri]